MASIAAPHARGKVGRCASSRVPDRPGRRLAGVRVRCLAGKRQGDASPRDAPPM